MDQLLAALMALLTSISVHSATLHVNVNPQGVVTAEAKVTGQEATVTPSETPSVIPSVTPEDKDADVDTDEVTGTPEATVTPQAKVAAFNTKSGKEMPTKVSEEALEHSKALTAPTVSVTPTVKEHSHTAQSTESAGQE